MYRSGLIFIVSVISLLIIFFFTTCQRELNFEILPVSVSTDTAMYTFTGAPNGCTNAQVNGTYIYGNALTIANTITISVNVISPGSYIILSDTLDGINFSKSGIFTTAGVQTVVLDGNGTPAQPRNLSFTLTGLSSSCNFSLTVRNPEPLAVYVLESGSGSPNPCVGVVIQGNYTANVPLNNSNSVSIRVTVTVTGIFTIATNTVNGISFSYTGTFTALGSQDVILSGEGTPISAGIFQFSPQIVGPAPIGGNGCAINLTIQ